MWRRVPCEQPLHTGQSILSPRRNPMLMNAGCHITIKKIFFLLVLAMPSSLMGLFTRKKGT